MTCLCVLKHEQNRADNVPGIDKGILVGVTAGRAWVAIAWRILPEDAISIEDLPDTGADIRLIDDLIAIAITQAR